MKNKLLYLLLPLFLFNQVQAEIRTWTDSASGKTIDAEYVSMSADGLKVTLKRKDLKTYTLEVSRLGQDDQDFLSGMAQKSAKDVEEAKASGPGRIELKAKTISSGGSRTAWSNTWAQGGSNGLTKTEGPKDESRIVGIYLNAPRDSHGGDYVVEMFWFGFPHSKKTKRYVCAYANDIVTVPAHSEVTIAASSGYRSKSSSLKYDTSSSSDWQRYYSSSWYGYKYAGWVVRVSDGKGNQLKVHGAQPSFARHIEDIPIPVKRR